MAYSEYKVCKPLQVKGDSTTVNLRLLYIYLGQKHTFYTQYFDTSSIREYRDGVKLLQLKGLCLFAL